MDIEEALIRDEGIELFPYIDTVGVLTIGVGRAIGKVGISHEEALYLLRNDIDHVRAELMKKVPAYHHLSPLRQQVLENMAFNLGIRGLLGFRMTLLLIEQGKYSEAADQMLLSNGPVR